MANYPFQFWLGSDFNANEPKSPLFKVSNYPSNFEKATGKKNQLDSYNVVDMGILCNWMPNLWVLLWNTMWCLQLKIWARSVLIFEKTAIQRNAFMIYTYSEECKQHEPHNVTETLMPCPKKTIAGNWWWNLPRLYLQKYAPCRTSRQSCINNMIIVNTKHVHSTILEIKLNRVSAAGDSA